MGILSRRVFLSVVGLAALTAAARGDEPAAKFKAGAAAADITPSLGGNIVGGFLPIPARHIHDPLHVRSLVLDDGATKLALVVCDLLAMGREVSDEARRLIAERSAIPRECVLISATHTHSACSALGSNRFPDHTGGQLDEYQQFVARRIADSVQCAADNLRPAELAFVRVDVPEHVFNRRWTMRPGTIPPNPFGGTDLVKMNPPAGSPNLMDPAGPVDPEVSLIAVRGTDGKPISVYAAYSLHYVGGVGPGHVSADYFAMFCDELARLLDADRQDPPFVAMLANGTSGDINNINFRQPRPGKPPYEQMRFVAHDVAAKVYAGLKDARYSSQIALAARYRELPVGWRHPDETQLAWARKTASEPTSTNGKANLPAIYAERTLRMAEYPETMPMPLQVLRIGPAAIGSMPCEVFCEIGLDFKRRSPLAGSFLVSLAHGSYGYLPTPRQHELGGYETWLGTNRLEKQASDKLLAALLEMAKELAP